MTRGDKYIDVQFRGSCLHEPRPAAQVPADCFWGRWVSQSIRLLNYGSVSLLLTVVLVAATLRSDAQAQSWTAELTGEAVATKASLSLDGDRTVFSLVTDRPILTRIFTLSRPFRIVIDASDLRFDLPAATGQTGKGLITQFRYGNLGTSRARIVLDLERPARFVSRLVEHGDRSATFSLELEETSPQAFRDDRQISDDRPVSGFQHASTPVPAPRVGNSVPIVVIDPGHGGVDPGAVAGDNAVEKEVTLAVGLLLREALVEAGVVKVVMTRVNDIHASLDERVAIASELNADLFVSLHADAVADREAAAVVRGATVYTMSEDPSDRWAQRLANRENAADTLAGIRASAATTDMVRSILVDLVRRESAERAAHFREVLIKRLGRSVKLSGTPRRSAAFRVLKQVGTPAVLIEIGYMSNPRDRSSLLDPKWQAKLADALSDSIVAYFRQR